MSVQAVYLRDYSGNLSHEYCINDCIMNSLIVN